MNTPSIATARWALALVLSLTLSACAGGGAAKPSAKQQAITAAVANTARSEADRAQDSKRMPAEVLALADIAPGQRVIDIFSAGGWYAEILAYTVGPKGQVYAQNPPSVLKRFGDKPITERLANNRLPNVVRWDREMNEMELAPATFDGAMINLVFHDLFWIAKDVPGFLTDLHRSLKKGAWVAVIDHAAPAGTGDAMAKDPRGQHRIDEAYTKDMFLRAGFRLVSESQMMRNPADDRQKAFFAPELRDQQTDKFIHIYRK